jgi:glycosyltransferase involved in cell wall biosynthesis
MRIRGDDALLEAAYRGARLVVVSSMYEGFGLPILEAVACGASVLASNAGSLREVGGDHIAYLAEILHAPAWTNALQKALSPSARQAEPLRFGEGAAPTQFAWSRTAALCLSAYRTIVS